MKQDIKNISLVDLTGVLKDNGLPKYCATQIFDWVYKKRVEDFSLMSNISKKARELLPDQFFFSKIKLLKRQTSSDGTEKFLFEFEDGFTIETVIIPNDDRATLCVSSQVGCKFKCKFCTSGKDGFKRNLTASEIINQFLEVSSIAESKITNVVFMGIGEPLDNFSNVVDAIKLLIEPKGLAMGKTKISVSTCGLVPEIEKLAKLNLGIKLSISLHSAIDSVREKIMPINKKYPLAELLKAIKKFSNSDKAAERSPVFFEYLLVKNINMSKEAVIALSKLLKGLRYKINLIIYNDSKSKDFIAPSAEEVDEFTAELKKKDIFFLVRKSRGPDIDAACGQLKAAWKEHKS